LLFCTKENLATLVSSTYILVVCITIEV
jgi:hypothetical protein